MNARRAADPTPRKKPWFWGFVGKTILATTVGWLTLGALTVAAALLFGGALLGLIGLGNNTDSTPTDTTESSAPSEESSDDPQAIGPPPGEVGATVPVLLEGSSTGPATVTWDEPGSYGNSVDIEAGPWALEIPDGEAGGTYHVSVTPSSYEVAEDVTCTITIDGEEADTGKASGIGAIASCDA